MLKIAFHSPIIFVNHPYFYHCQTHAASRRLHRLKIELDTHQAGVHNVLSLYFVGGVEDIVRNYSTHFKAYFNYCAYLKNLDAKTLKAYGIDLKQFVSFASESAATTEKELIINFVEQLHGHNKPKTVKRKIAAIKAFFNYLEDEEVIEHNPFKKIKIKYNEPKTLPKTIPLEAIRQILNMAYDKISQQKADKYAYHAVLRDITVLELLFATGMRVSELCSLKVENFNLEEKTLKIMGKGAKERVINLANEGVLSVIKKYMRINPQLLQSYLFTNRSGNRLSEQSVRFMIKKYVKLAGLPMHVTPHMFRHSFATLLLEEDVDIRYIQKMLGHSSIMTTQIYTHVTSQKQKNILTSKHPRNKLSFCLPS